MKRLLLILFVLLAGCIVDDPEKSVPNTGDEGIRAEFVEGQPEEKIYQDQPMELVTEYRNMGSYDKPFGKVVLYGYDSSVIKFESQKENYAKKELPELNAKTSYTPKGGYATISFNAEEINVEPREQYKTEVILGACYHYKTSLTEEVCLSDDDSACEGKTKRHGGQGAPVAITKLEQEMVSDKLDIVATIENVGKGKVITPAKNSYEDCPFNLHKEDVNKVQVNITVNGLEKEECSNSGMLSLSNGETKIHCTFSGESGGGYETQLNAELNYFYMNKDERELTILS